MTDSTLSLAVLLAVKPFLIEAKSFETAQNRLASSLSGVPARQANDKGIPALKLLVASAPPADAAAVFIPQQRAMFVLRHVAGWLSSDDADDLDEEVEYRIAGLYTVLAPVVQSMPGAHWDSIFDLIETGLDVSARFLHTASGADRSPLRWTTRQALPCCTNACFSFGK